jgi:hypothetical protein
VFKFRVFYLDVEQGPQPEVLEEFHLEGMEAGRRVAVFKIDPGGGERLDLLAKATVGEGGRVDLDKPITVRAGDTFVAVPEKASWPK